MFKSGHNIMLLETYLFISAFVCFMLCCVVLHSKCLFVSLRLGDTLLFVLDIFSIISLLLSYMFISLFLFNRFL